VGVASPTTLIAACRRWLIAPTGGPQREAIGVEGNGRLTAVNGMLLIGLLAVVAVAASLVAGIGLASALLPAAHDWTSHRYDQREHRGR
jgi:hypothetical protein